MIDSKQNNAKVYFATFFAVSCALWFSTLCYNVNNLPETIIRDLALDKIRTFPRHPQKHESQKIHLHILLPIASSRVFIWKVFCVVYKVQFLYIYDNWLIDPLRDLSFYYGSISCRSRFQKVKPWQFDMSCQILKKH